MIALVILNVGNIYFIYFKFYIRVEQILLIDKYSLYLIKINKFRLSKDLPSRPFLPTTSKNTPAS